MLTRKNLILLTLLSFCALSLISQSILPKNQNFRLDPEAAFTPGVVVFKVKPELRAACRPDEIHHPLLSPILQSMQVHTLHKAIPGIQPPGEETNAWGQKWVDLSLVYEAWFDPSLDMEWAVNMILSSDAVLYAEPLYQYELFYDPNDPDTADQYYLDLMKIREAWDVTKGDSSIAIGIIDTGTSFSHDELENQVFYNLNDTIDGIDNDNNGFVDDYRGWDFGGVLNAGTAPITDNDPTYVGTDHGVLVAGAAVAEADNQLCIAAVGFHSRYVPIKVTSDGGDVVVKGYHGIIYGALRELPFLNCSWGGTSYSHFGKDAVDFATINKGSVVIAACGNSATQLVFYPASYANCISVGGTQGSDAVWIDSPTYGSSYSYLVDCVAPGKNVKVPAQNSQCWGNATGTSLAAPIVAGVAALTKAYYPAYTNMQIAQKVRVTSDDLYSIWPNAYTDRFGRGRVNAYRALMDTTPSLRALNIDIVYFRRK